MLFAFRGIRMLQVICAVVALVCGLAAILLVKTYSDGNSVFVLIPAIVLGLMFLWMFSLAMRLPTSFVAVGEDKTRIRFAGFVDTIIANGQIAGVEPVRHQWWRGVGVRTSLGGSIALASTWGPAALLTLRSPIRVWVIPRIWPVHPTRVVVTVRNPQKLVERFGSGPPEPVASSGGQSVRKMRARARRR